MLFDLENYFSAKDDVVKNIVQSFSVSSNITPVVVFEQGYLFSDLTSLMFIPLYYLNPSTIILESNDLMFYNKRNGDFKKGSEVSEMLFNSPKLQSDIKFYVNAIEQEQYVFYSPSMLLTLQSTEILKNNTLFVKLRDSNQGRNFFSAVRYKEYNENYTLLTEDGDVYFLERELYPFIVDEPVLSIPKAMNLQKRLLIR